ncbi:MAG: MFS transporter, partial [Bacteroidota bacterium]
MKNNRLAVNIIFFINGFVFANWAARLPLLQDTYYINHKMLGFVLLSSSIGALFAMPFTGWMISKNGSRKITQRSAFLYLCTVPFIPLSPNYWTLIVTFFAMGLMTGTLDVAMNAQAVVIEKAYKKPIMSFFHAMFSAGMMIGAGSGALFERFEVNLFYHFLSIILMSIIAYTWCVRHLIRDEVSEEEKETSFFKLPDPALMSIGVIAFCCMLGEGAMSDWSSNYMTRIVKADLSTAPLGLFAFALAMMIGRFLGDAARVRLGDQKLLLFGGLFATAGVTLIITSPFTIPAISGFFLIGIGLSTIVPIAYSQAGSMPGIAP